MQDFDGDTSKLATHRKTTPFATGGKLLRVPTMAPLPPIVPEATIEKLKAAARSFDRNGPTPEVHVEVKGALDETARGIARHMIYRAVFSELPVHLGIFPFMMEQPPQRLVVIESPFGHPTKVGMDENAAYARKCMLDSLKRGEAPYASHLLYTQCLDDLKVSERKQGMEAGFAWGAAAQHVAVYVDRGISRGMLEGIRRHHANDLTIEFRSIQ